MAVLLERFVTSSPNHWWVAMPRTSVTNRQTTRSPTDRIPSEFEANPSLLLGYEASEFIVPSGASAGDYSLLVSRPRYIGVKTSGAAITDVGRTVYAAYNDEVGFSPGTYGNVIGTVHEYVSATRVIVKVTHGVGAQANREVGAATGSVLRVPELVDLDRRARAHRADSVKRIFSTWDAAWYDHLALRPTTPLPPV